jgi:hypothetical protein
MKAAPSVLLALSLCLLGAGCSSGGSATPASSTGARTTAGSSGGESSQPSSGAGNAICSQLTRAEVQPLLADPITNVVLTPLTNEQLPSVLTEGKKVEGQTCAYAVAGTAQALTINVLGGSDSSVMYTADLQGLSQPVSVPGVGDKATRDGSDSTPIVTSVKGSLYCSVTPQSDEIPGLAPLMKAAGNTGDIGDANYAVAATAVATLCNRIYGSGNTTPDLSSLATATPPTPTGGGLPTNFGVPTDGASTS